MILDTDNTELDLDADVDLGAAVVWTWIQVHMSSGKISMLLLDYQWTDIRAIESCHPGLEHVDIRS